jgi:DNA-binding response OmpR family regulator
MRILLIDDDDDVRFNVRFTLERIGGFEVAEAASGPEGLRLAAAEPPDLVLLDVMMPQMDGSKMLVELRLEPELARIPVVFLTAKAMPSEIQRLVALGATDVITKPFEPRDLSARVRAALGRQDRGQAPPDSSSTLLPRGKP